ncbi:MAG: CDGSH iron-sulfur domain-containing protein [Candidatus Micrarchaeia archaeon]|jgi:CDGSH-type Zn-finger protein
MNGKKSGKIIVEKDGPYLVSGSVPLDKEEIACDENGDPEDYKKVKDYPGQEKYALCRCGLSKNKPYCDGSHAKSGFDGTETASRIPYKECSDSIEGPHITLMDNPDLCFGAGFCHRKGGTWNLAQSPDKKDSELAITEACNCPSGRLVAVDKKTGKTIEKTEKQSLTLLEDTRRGVSGPICARGGIPIVYADGREYECRNRVSLCRCGKSYNKPLCDGSHVKARFKDE